MPPSGGGLYFFSTHLVYDDKKWGRFVMNKNREALCGFYEDNQDSSNEDGAGSCSATVELDPGEKKLSHHSRFSQLSNSGKSVKGVKVYRILKCM